MNIFLNMFNKVVLKILIRGHFTVGAAAVLPYLDFMPGLISTFLSELATTRTNTSPASGWFCLFKYLFTRSSMYMPNLVVCSPARKIPSNSSVVLHVIQMQVISNLTSSLPVTEITSITRLQWWIHSDRHNYSTQSQTYFWQRTCSLSSSCRTSSDRCRK